jgi:hypothetical protein
MVAIIWRRFLEAIFRFGDFLLANISVLKRFALVSTSLGSIGIQTPFDAYHYVALFVERIPVNWDELFAAILKNPSKTRSVRIGMLVHEQRLVPSRDARRGRRSIVPNPYALVLWPGLTGPNIMTDDPRPRLSHGQGVPRKEQNSCQNQCSSRCHACSPFVCIRFNPE